MRKYNLQRRRTVHLRRLVQLKRNQLAVSVQDQNRVRRGKRHLGGDHRPKAVRQPVHAHQMHERDHQEGSRQHIGHKRNVADEPAATQVHPSQCEADQRSNQYGQHHGRCRHVDAVAELVPEMLEVPVILFPDDAEAVPVPVYRPDHTGELVAIVAQRDQQHVVDRYQRPDEQRDAEKRTADPGPQAATAQARPIVRPNRSECDAHSCTPVNRMRRISSSTAGMRTGNADIIAATPRLG